jgi:hypothetical protein
MPQIDPHNPLYWLESRANSHALLAPSRHDKQKFCLDLSLRIFFDCRAGETAGDSIDDERHGSAP